MLDIQHLASGIECLYCARLFVVHSIGFVPERQTGAGTFGEDSQFLLGAGDRRGGSETLGLDLPRLEIPISFSNRIQDVLQHLLTPVT